MIIDSHAHYTHNAYSQNFRYLTLTADGYALSEGNREQLFRELKDANIPYSIEPGINLESCERVGKIAEDYPGRVFPAMGIHPTRAIFEKWSDRKKLDAFARAPGVIAIGETGLDYHFKREEQHRLKQHIWFLYQLDLAWKLKLPVILHIRDAHADALRILRLHPARKLGGVVHCFYGSREIAEQYLKLGYHIGIGGGEFLLSLNHPHENTAATENYPPNVALCGQVLLPLGIDFRPGDGKGKLPFDDGSFDLVINRHGDFNAEEIHRVLKPGGLFITQQVGAENDRELVALLCGEREIPFPEQHLDLTVRKFEDAGFEILESGEAFRPIRFFDVGALVWFARIIQWEFPGFSVDTHLEHLLNAQRILEENGSIDGSVHRFLLVARKEHAK